MKQLSRAPIRPTNTWRRLHKAPRRSKLSQSWVHWPSYRPDEVAAVENVLRSGAVNQWTGHEVVDFEEEYARYLDLPHAVAVMNGTVALELALLSVGIGPGDEVITSPRTFIASASAAVMRGAVPVLADVDRDSGNITAATIAPVITDRTRAIVVVHLAGWPADMDPILELAEAHNLFVIEDCAQAHGATYRGRSVGTLGQLGAFSFCQDKIITTGGEGGLLALRDDEQWNRAWSFKDHGKSYDAVFTRDHPPGYRWLHESFGTNWRMTEIQAAIGRLQLQRLAETTASRRRNASIWREHLEPLDGLRVPEPPSSSGHAYYKLYGYVVPRSLKPGWNRERIQAELNEAGVPLRVGSCSEIYRELAFITSELGPSSPLPVAHELGETSLMFEVHPTLGADLLHEAAALTAEVVRQATR